MADATSFSVERELSTRARGPDRPIAPGPGWPSSASYAAWSAGSGWLERASERRQRKQAAA